MKIRRAGVKDIPELARLMRLIIGATSYYSELAKKEEIRKHAPRLLKQYLDDKKYYSFLVALDMKKIVGFALGRNEAGVFWADWIGVKKEMRRMGVAESLMEEWHKLLAQNGVHKIWCDTRTTNKESISLLKKLKYKKLGIFKNGWYRQDFFLWEKDL